MMKDRRACEEDVVIPRAQFHDHHLQLESVPAGSHGPDLLCVRRPSHRFSEVHYRSVSWRRHNLRLLYLSGVLRDEAFACYKCSMNPCSHTGQLKSVKTYT